LRPGLRHSAPPDILAVFNLAADKKGPSGQGRRKGDEKNGKTGEGMERQGRT